MNERSFPSLCHSTAFPSPSKRSAKDCKKCSLASARSGDRTLLSLKFFASLLHGRGIFDLRALQEVRGRSQ